MLLQEEERKAQAKVFALGSRDKTLRKQAQECQADQDFLLELEVVTLHIVF